jgi:hypothetical protein
MLSATFSFFSGTSSTNFVLQPGLDALCTKQDSLDDVVLTLLNPNHAVRVKTNVISIMLSVCSNSESGYKYVTGFMRED